MTRYSDYDERFYILFIGQPLSKITNKWQMIIVQNNAFEFL